MGGFEWVWRPVQWNERSEIREDGAGSEGVGAARTE